MPRIRIMNTSLATHGSGPLYSVFIGRSRWGRGLRLSYGGYSHDRPWWRPHFTRYRGVATHFGIGPCCVSIVGM